MRLSVITALAPLLATALFAASSAGGADSSSNASSSNLAPSFRFPSVESQDLDKRLVKLPKDFAGERNLVVIAFQRQQQKDVDTWLDVKKRFETIDPALRYYELPTLARLNPLARWFIDNGMRGGIPSHEQRARTITLYLDKEPFRAALGLGALRETSTKAKDKASSKRWSASFTPISLCANSAAMLRDSSCARSPGRRGPLSLSEWEKSPACVRNTLPTPGRSAHAVRAPRTGS